MRLPSLASPKTLLRGQAGKASLRVWAPSGDRFPAWAVSSPFPSPGGRQAEGHPGLSSGYRIAAQSQQGLLPQRITASDQVTPGTLAREAGEWILAPRIA